MRDEFALDREDDMEQYKYTHIKELLLWLRDEVISACGDGDAIWITKTYKLEEIREVALEVFKGFWRWEVTEIDIAGHKRYFNIGEYQEWITITDAIEWPVPSWQQCTVIF